jgi:flavin reductase (DIM6/NTAB) family NADH-FMN oxidoreductase RutF
MKKKFKPGTMLNPVPTVMVTCGDMEGVRNIITIAWTGIVNSEPPMTYVSVRKSRFSHHLIQESGEFVINLPSESMTFAMDYCGVKSGKDEDKFQTQKLTPVAGDLVSCPMIAEAPVNLECVVKDVREYPSHDMFVAEIVSVHVDDAYLDEKGKLDFGKMGLICYNHGFYYGLQSKPLGRFGYSVMKPKTKKRIAAEASKKPVRKNPAK